MVLAFAARYPGTQKSLAKACLSFSRAGPLSLFPKIKVNLKPSPFSGLPGEGDNTLHRKWLWVGLGVSQSRSGDGDQAWLGPDWSLMGPCPMLRSSPQSWGLQNHKLPRLEDRSETRDFPSFPNYCRN